MPLVITADFPSVTPSLYEATHRGAMSDGRPDGMIAHCCFEKNGGISVVDMWESKAHFDAFVQNKVAPVLQQHNVEGGPENLVMTELLNADAFAYTGNVLSG
jgi:hypothetical protein